MSRTSSVSGSSSRWSTASSSIAPASPSGTVTTVRIPCASAASGFQLSSASGWPRPRQPELIGLGPDLRRLRWHAADAPDERAPVLQRREPAGGNLAQPKPIEHLLLHEERSARAQGGAVVCNQGLCDVARLNLLVGEAREVFGRHAEEVGEGAVRPHVRTGGILDRHCEPVVAHAAKDQARRPNHLTSSTSD